MCVATVLFSLLTLYIFYEIMYAQRELPVSFHLLILHITYGLCIGYLFSCQYTWLDLIRRIKCVPIFHHANSMNRTSSEHIMSRRTETMFQITWSSLVSCPIYQERNNPLSSLCRAIDAWHENTVLTTKSVRDVLRQSFGFWGQGLCREV